ncbi:MAG TPA: NAD(P)-dependent oxidoreductase [Caulobacteraceae bacterium]
MRHRPDRPALVGAGAERVVAGQDRIVVTGAGGWLGLATLEMLSGLLREDFHRRVVCFGAHARALKLRGGVRIEQRPIAEMADLAPAPSLVLHLAFVTQGPAMTLDREGYVEANLRLSATVLAALDRIGARAIFMASSGAVHMRDLSGGPQSKELYGALKYIDEAVFADWADRRGATAVIGRVFNLSGPYINRRSSYALSSMIDDALSGRPVAVRATTPVFRSYVAIEILMCVVMGLLTEPAAGVSRFETAGGRVVEMGDLAGLVAKVLGAPGVDRPAFDPAAPADHYVGNGAAFAPLVRQYGYLRRPLSTQIRQTAAFMAQWPDEAELRAAG